MIVVKKNSTKETHEIVCDHCGATLEYTDNDTFMFPNDYKEYLRGFFCPCCNYEIVTEVISESENKPKFPDDFFYFGGNDCSKLSDEEMQKYVNEVKNSLENADIGEYFYTGTGDTMVFGVKHEDEDVIMVAKNYYEWSSYGT